MYETFFQLKSRPFLAAPRVDHYFPAAAMETARRNLTRAVERAEGPGLLVGPAGTGKSLLCQVLAEQFKHDFQVVHFSSARLCTRRAMLQAILYELELPYREKEEGELRLALIDHLTGAEAARPNLLFIVDEAHALPLRLLEEMRMITNLLRQGQPCVRLVLAGSPALEERFASPKLESFNQRIAARCYLDSFDQHDTYQYVCAQMTASGRNAHDVFSDGALEAVYRATDGVPRLVNQVCDHALLLAHAGQSPRVEAENVEEAWAELQQLPAPWSSASKPRSAEPSVVEFGALDDEKEAERAVEAIEADEPAAAADLEIQIRDVEDVGEDVCEPDDGDDQWAAVPFPGREREAETLEHLEQIERRLAELDDDFQPVGTIGPEIEVCFEASRNPFDEAFDEEEIVIDRYAMLDEDVLAGRPRVQSLGDDGVAEMLKRHEHLAMAEPRPQLAIAQAAEDSEAREAADDDAPLYDAVLPEEVAETDGDLIVIEEEEAAPAAPPPRARRQDYRQLFARLRRA